MKSMYKKGEIQVATMAIMAVVSFGAAWLGNYILGSPEVQARAVDAISIRQSATEARLNTLCNDYGQTIYRVDQNMQNIGKALKIDIVVGKANLDPCK